MVVDGPHEDLRRARSSLMNLIPTSTGSATAIGIIYPELQGKLNGLAVRVPLLNASLTDCVFEVARNTSAEEVNSLIKAAADGPLAGILGYEERPLVSTDFLNDALRFIVDGLIDKGWDDTQLKVLFVVRITSSAMPAAWPNWQIRSPQARRPASCSVIIRDKDGDLRTILSSQRPIGVYPDGWRAAHARLAAFSHSCYTPLELALLFLLYEFFGVVTNLLAAGSALDLG